MLKTTKIALCVSGVAIAGLAHAEGMLEETIVTAQHRAENVQDVPIAVSALSADELKQADIFDAGTIAQHVPGMVYAEFSPGQANISMRGVSSADDGAGLDNSVALFLDGVYIGRGASINFDMFDLERLEVLRGPQGTLFGRNAIGGAISVITSKPTDELTARVGTTVGNEGILRYQGLISGPFSESVAGKISINHREHDGFVDNVVLNKDQQDEDQTSIRGQLLFSIGESDWLLSADAMEDDREDMGRTPIVSGAFPTVEIWRANGGDVRKATSPADGFSEREANGVSLQGDISFAGGTLTTITAFRHAETDWEMQSVGAGLGAAGLPFDEVNDDIVEDIDTFSQELRWTSALDGIFNFTTGLYYLTEETERIEQFKISAAGTYDQDTLVLIDRGSQAIIGNEYAASFNDTTSYAIYGQGTWDFSEQWSLTLGARYTLDEKDYRANSVDCGQDRTGTAFENFAACAGLGGSLNIINESFDVSTDDDWDDFSPKVAVEFHPSDGILLFASASKGFKSGGFAGSQGVEAAATNPVDPEIAWNYELGFKGDLLDDSLRLNVTAFYTDYEDLQIVRFGPVPGSDFGTFQTTNIGEAEILGAELEFTWFMTENFRFSGNYAYLDTEVNDLIINTAGGDVDASGSALRQAPENSTSLSLAYDLPTAVGNFDFRLDYSNIDDQITDYVNQDTVVQRAELWDGRIGWYSTSEKWEVALWAKNMLDSDYISHSYVIGPGVIGVWGPPRTFGVSATWNL